MKYRYRKAAKLLSDPSNKNGGYRGCCYVIGMVGSDVDRRWFRQVFEPTLSEYNYVNNSEKKDYVPAFWMGDKNKKNSLSRSLAMLFMHEMEKEMY